MQKQRTFLFPGSVLIVAVVALTFMLLVSSMPAAAQDVKLKVVPVVYTHPDNGQQMYVTYCAPCHGMKGDGKGPAAPAFKYAPTNLTTLAKTHNGKFPTDFVRTTIKMGAPTQAHGSVQMPVWGDAFRNIDGGFSGVAPLRIANLTEYIRSLQK